MEYIAFSFSEINMENKDHSPSFLSNVLQSLKKLGGRIGARVESALLGGDKYEVTRSDRPGLPSEIRSKAKALSSNPDYQRDQLLHARSQLTHLSEGKGSKTFFGLRKPHHVRMIDKTIKDGRAAKEN